MIGVHLQSCVVALLCLPHLSDKRDISLTQWHHVIATSTYAALLLQSIGQVAVGIWEVRLELYGSPIRVNGQLYEPEWWGEQHTQYI